MYSEPDKWDYVIGLSKIGERVHFITVTIASQSRKNIFMKIFVQCMSYTRFFFKYLYESIIIAFRTSTIIQARPYHL